VVAQMVIDIRDQNVEGDSAIESLGVGFGLRSVSDQCVDYLGIAPPITILDMAERKGMRRAPERSKRRDNKTDLPAT